MKEGENILVPGINKDGSLFLATIKKVFRDGSVWIIGKEKTQEVNMILTWDQVKELQSNQQK